MINSRNPPETNQKQHFWKLEALGAAFKTTQSQEIRRNDNEAMKRLGAMTSCWVQLFSG